jgi:phage head maturation protease
LLSLLKAGAIDGLSIGYRTERGQLGLWTSRNQITSI